MKKNLQWLAAFSALALLTGISLIDTSGSFKKIIGNVASASNKVVIINAVDTLKNESWIQRFTKLYDDQMVCSVDDNQLSDLSANFGATTEHLTIDSKDVTVVRVQQQGPSMNHRDVMQYLQTSATGDLNCKLVRSQHWFYLLFSAHMS